MTLQEFKFEAQRRGHFHDNRESAQATWWKGWGLGYPSSERWAYKGYQLGGLEFKSGKVLCRHGSYSQTSCSINGEGCGRTKFVNFLQHFTAPELTPEEQAYIQEQERLEAERRAIYHEKALARWERRQRKEAANRQQLEFNFEAA